MKKCYKITKNFLAKTWPFWLFVIYAITQLTLLKNIWAAALITLLVAIPLFRYYKIEPRQFQKKWFTKILIVFGALILLLLTVILFSLLLKYLHIPLETSKNQLSLQKMAKANFPKIAFDTVIMAPIFEEGVFRAGLISFKNKAWLIISSILSTAFFAVCHIAGSINIFVFISYLIPGTYFMLTYLYTRDVKCNILLHMLYNSVALVALI